MTLKEKKKKKKKKPSSHPKHACNKASLKDIVLQFLDIACIFNFSSLQWRKYDILQSPHVTPLLYGLDLISA